MYTYVYMYSCMYVYTHVYVPIHVGCMFCHALIYRSKNGAKPAPFRVKIDQDVLLGFHDQAVCVCMYVCMCACMCVCVCVCACVCLY